MNKCFYHRILPLTSCNSAPRPAPSFSFFDFDLMVWIGGPLLLSIPVICQARVMLRQRYRWYHLAYFPGILFSLFHFLKEKCDSLFACKAISSEMHNHDRFVLKENVMSVWGQFIQGRASYSVIWLRSGGHKAVSVHNYTSHFPFLDFTNHIVCVWKSESLSLSLIKGRKGYDLNRGEDCHWLKDGGRPWVRSLTSQMTSLSKTNFFRHSKRTKWRTWHFANNTAGSHSLNVNIYMFISIKYPLFNILLQW